VTPVDTLDWASVLVVDDEPANVALLAQLLMRVGVAQVHTSVDPRQALGMYEALRPDLVLLDLHMPGMDGLALMAAIARSTDPDDAVPVVILTADSTAPARERALAAGASDFLTKPFDLTEVELRARNLLQTRALHSRLRAELEERRAAEIEAQEEAERRRAAVQRVLDAGGPRMVFQPIVILPTGKVVGYEALARFDDEPVRPPDEWFADAASVGLGDALELAAVDAALRHLPLVEPEHIIGVNVSPSVAASDELDRLLARYPAHRVVLEVTEHVPVADYDVLLAALDRLRSRGVSLAVDDAGAGYAGLDHILRLQPNFIKLDISLTRGIDTSPVKRALASALTRFAAEIGSHITAEGIETGAELGTLTDLGVTAGQGYFLGRPEPLQA